MTICPSCGYPEVERGTPCGCSLTEKEKAVKEATAKERENAPPYHLPADIK